MTLIDEIAAGYPRRLSDAELHALTGGASVGAALTATKMTARATGSRGRLFPLVGRVGIVGFFRDRANDSPAGASGACAGATCVAK